MSSNIFDFTSCLVNKFLNFNGSITDQDGNLIYPADESRARLFQIILPTANKILQSDGSIIGFEDLKIISDNIIYDNNDQTNVKEALDTLFTRLINLEDKYEIKSIWEEITTTTGTITTYDNIAIKQRDWFEGQYNAKVVSITISGEPEDKAVYTSSGKEVKAVIEIDGTYTLSGLPTALNYGIIWQVTGTAKDFGLANIPENKIIAEYDDASPFTRVDTTIQPLFNGDNINLLNGGLKDTNVVNAIKLGDLDNTSFISENKSMVGSFNELWKIVNVSQTITVAKDGTGNFSTIQEAIDFITDATSDKKIRNTYKIRNFY